MIKGHKIERKIRPDDFLEIVRSFDEANMITTRHTFFRLREKDRKIFKDIIVKEIVTKEMPLLAGIQYNGVYAVFYRYGPDTLKILLDIQAQKMFIVTFYIIDHNQIPRL